MSSLKDLLKSPELATLYDQACHTQQGFEEVWEGYLKQQFSAEEGYKAEERLLLHDYFSLCHNLKVTCITRLDCPMVILWIKQDVGDINMMGRVSAAMAVNDVVSEWENAHKNAVVSSGWRCAIGLVKARTPRNDGSGMFYDNHDDLIPYELHQIAAGEPYDHFPSWDARSEAALIQEQIDYIKQEMVRYSVGVHD